MTAAARWDLSAREFFHQRGAQVQDPTSLEALCYVSGREPRLWSDPEMLADLTACIRDQLDLRPDHTLLEVGCAAGYIARALAPLVGRYHGVDVAPGPLEAARGLGLPNADFRVADGSRLPYPDGSLDRVICYDVFTNFPTFAAVEPVLRDMIRVCKPGGLVMAGSIPDAAREADVPARIVEVAKELDAKYGPLKPPPVPPLPLQVRVRDWFNRRVRGIQPGIVCYYFHRADFERVGRETGMDTRINPIHPLNPYHGFRFNVVYRKPEAA